MDSITVTIDEDIQQKVEAAFEDVMGFSDKPLTLSSDESSPQPHRDPKLSKLKVIQSMPITQVIHPDFTQIVQENMPEAVEALSKLDANNPPLIRIKNAPLSTPFGKGDDSSYQNQFPDEHAPIEDRQPVAECVLMALASAAHLSIDSFTNDNHGKVWTYPTPLKAGKGGNNEEHSADTIFPFHTDGSMLAEPSEFIMLAAGTVHPEAETIIVDQDKLYTAIEKYDKEHNSIVLETLQKPIFEHIPGTSSKDKEDVFTAPILSVYDSGKKFFRGNLAENDDGKRIGIKDGLSHHVQDSAMQAISVFEELANSPSVYEKITIDEGEAVFFANGPHSRTAFPRAEKPENDRFLMRYGAKSENYVERFKQESSTSEISR